MLRASWRNASGRPATRCPVTVSDAAPHKPPAHPATERSTALTENAALADSEFVPCHCCGRSFPAPNMVRFDRHPGDAICVTCVAWLHDRSRPIARRLNPILPLAGRIRARSRLRESDDEPGCLTAG